jgi:hypothetical protein
MIGYVWFFGTMQSALDPFLKMACIPVISTVLLCLYFILSKCYRKIPGKIIAFVGVYVFFSILHEKYSILFYAPFMLFSLGVFYGKISFISTEKITNILLVTLSIHVFFLYTQVAIFFYSGEYVDLLKYLSVESSSNFSLKGYRINDQLIPRFSGLYNEPGTYSIWVFLQLLVWQKFEQKKRHTIVLYLTLTSILLTASAYGYVMILIFILQKINLKNLLLLGFLFFITILFLVGRFESGYGIGERLYIFEALKNNPSWLIFGVGDVAGLLRDDAGQGISSILHGGILTLLALLVLLSESWIVALIVLIAKIKLTYPFLYYILLLWRVKNERQISSNNPKI